MSRDVATIAPEATLSAALARMVALNVGSLVVTRRTGSRLQRTDLLGLLPVFFALRASTTGGGDASVITAAVTLRITARADEPIGSVLSRMTDNQTWRLVVLDEEDVVGVISATDIMKLLAGARRESIA